MAILPVDEWNSLTLGALFGNLAGYITSELAKLNGDYSKLVQLLQAVQTKLSAAAGLIAVTKSFVSQLEASGFYVIVLDPQLGGWSGRLIGAPGAPPTTGYSTGVAIIAQAPDLALITARYSALTAVLFSPLPV